MKNALAILIAIALFSTQYLQATTYYVSPTGNDLNSGTSTGSPWKTIRKVDSTVFSAGDVILFEGGKSFPGTLYFDKKDQGTPTSPITLGSYGTGRATISSGIEVGIYAYNAGGYKINNLKIVGSGPTTNQSSGILFYMDSTTSISRLKYVFISDVEIYGYSSNGVCIGSWNSSNGFDDVTVTNSNIHDIGFVGIGSYARLRLGHKNFNISNNTVYNVFGNGDTAQHTGSGILIGGVDGAVVEKCNVYNNGAQNKDNRSGPVGIWAYQANNVIFRNNESHHNQTQGRDGGGFDFDGGVTNSIMENNYSHDNAGSGYLLCQFKTIYQWNNNIVRYNKSVNDGLKNNYGAIHIYSNNQYGGVNNAQIHNNEIISPYARGVFIQSTGVYNTIFRNNKFTITDSKVTVWVSVNNPTVKFERNDYGNPATFKVTYLSKNYTTQKAWRDSTGQENFILREVWSNVTGSSVSKIPTGTKPSAVTYLDSYEAPQNVANSFGERISGYIVAPQTGNYLFWIAGDDDCNLFLSTNGNPKNKVKIAGFVGRTNFREFTKYSKQKSAQISLSAGNKYYIEILHKDSIDADHVSVQWQLPNGTIQVPLPGTNFSSSRLATSSFVSTPYVGEEKELFLSAYPNPYKSSSAVQFSSKTSGKLSMILYDMHGRPIKQLFNGNVDKDVLNRVNVGAGELLNGMYFIKLYGNRKTATLKLMQQK